MEKVSKNEMFKSRQDEYTEKILGESCMFEKCIALFHDFMWVHKSAVGLWDRKSHLQEEGNCSCECGAESVDAMFIKTCYNGSKAKVTEIPLEVLLFGNGSHNSALLYN